MSNDPVGANTNNGSNFNRYWYANDNPFRYIDPDGRYVCSKRKTTQDECAQFEKAYKEIEAAAKNKSNDKATRDALNAVLKFFGTPHTMNGVTLNRFGASKGAYASTGKYSTGTVISFNPANMETGMRGFESTRVP